MLNVNELNVEIQKIKGDIKLIERGIDTIKTNHLKHFKGKQNTYEFTGNL